MSYRKFLSEYSQKVKVAGTTVDLLDGYKDMSSAAMQEAIESLTKENTTCQVVKVRKTYEEIRREERFDQECREQHGDFSSKPSNINPYKTTYENVLDPVAAETIRLLTTMKTIVSAMETAAAAVTAGAGGAEVTPDNDAAAATDETVSAGAGGMKP